MLNKKQVQHIANLARIKLGKNELAKYSQELSSILGYVDQLGKVKTASVLSLSQVASLKNIWRKDSPQKAQCLSQEEVLSNAPQKENGFFKVKSVF